MTEKTKTGWFKSSYSGDGNGCLEVTPEVTSLGIVPTRDSKLAESPVVTLSVTGFSSLVAHAKADQI